MAIKLTTPYSPPISVISRKEKSNPATFVPLLSIVATMGALSDLLELLPGKGLLGPGLRGGTSAMSQLYQNKLQR